MSRIECYSEYKSIYAVVFVSMNKRRQFEKREKMWEKKEVSTEECITVHLMNRLVNESNVPREDKWWLISQNRLAKHMSIPQIPFLWILFWLQCHFPSIILRCHDCFCISFNCAQFPIKIFIFSHTFPLLFRSD